MGLGRLTNMHPMRFPFIVVVALALLASSCGSDPTPLSSSAGSAAPGNASALPADDGVDGEVDGAPVATTAPIEAPDEPAPASETEGDGDPPAATADDSDTSPAEPTSTPVPAPPVPTATSTPDSSAADGAGDATSPTPDPAPPVEEATNGDPTDDDGTPGAADSSVPTPAPPVADAAGSDDAVVTQPSPPVDAGASDGWQRTTSMPELLGAVSVVPDELVVTADGMTLLVRYWNGTEPCAGAKVTVTETATEVLVRLKTGANPGAATMTCIAMLSAYEIAVPLASPLGNRALVTANDGDTNRPPPIDPGPIDAVFSVGQYLGLSQAEAEELAAIEGRDLRVARVDDEWYALTMDVVPSRVNIELENGIVVAANGG